jgi:hypothetical protein
MEPVEAVFLDWGNTLMVDDGSQSGPMATWPDVSVVDGAPNLGDDYQPKIAPIASPSAISAAIATASVTPTARSTL